MTKTQFEGLAVGGEPTAAEAEPAAILEVYRQQSEAEQRRWGAKPGMDTVVGGFPPPPRAPPPPPPDDERR